MDMSLSIVVVSAMCGLVGALPSWTFDTEADVKAWVANSMLANVSANAGVLRFDAVDWDPFLTCKGIEFPATPWQCLYFRIRADRPGDGQVFWSGQTTGKYDGFEPNKNTEFHLKGNGEWEEVVLFPFWQGEGVMRQFRFDVYEGAHFDLDTIAVQTWGGDTEPRTDVFEWSFGGDASAWRVEKMPNVLMSPPLALAVEDKGWVTVQLRSDRESSAVLLWAAQNVCGVQRQPFTIRAGDEPRYYNIEVQGLSAWQDPLAVLGLELPTEAELRIESVRIADEPLGPPEVEVSYFGFEDGVNRSDRASSVLAQFWNRGGSAVGEMDVSLGLSDGLEWAHGAARQSLRGLDYDDQTELTWQVVAKHPGAYTVTLTAEGEGAPAATEATLDFVAPVDVPQAEYVPEPRPVATDLDTCMYYFPGWNSDAKWDCIRRVSPIRKPLLGYYDEGHPECVDWQIKWAVENGITCFLVDWYWSAGHQHLEHWFAAYREAKYRDQLKVAIMWANHNAPNTHSAEDWRNVTREWIDRYFNLPAYYHVDGKPAVFIWAPSNVRRDLGGSEQVAAALAESQAMARDAGYAGITYLAMSAHESESGVNALLEEGYYGATNYHEWGRATEMSGEPRRARFEDVAATAADSWKEKVARCGQLKYYPDVDTGWDSRPWHGDASLVIHGRTPELFERLLRQGKDYCREIGREFVVLGPANEWGEGSYVEPNNEFGFEMYEAIRRVFATGDPASWPENFGPRDVGLGPYDFPVWQPQTGWTFDQSPEGWAAMMGVSNLVCENGALLFTTVSSDPAIVVTTRDLRAKRYPTLVVTMEIEGAASEKERAQLFFSVGGSAITEATSVQFPIVADGAMHTYTVDLTQNPRWRSRIATLRFDPCGGNDLRVRIDEFRFGE